MPAAHDGSHCAISRSGFRLGFLTHSHTCKQTNDDPDSGYLKRIHHDLHISVEHLNHWLKFRGKQGQSNSR